MAKKKSKVNSYEEFKYPAVCIFVPNYRSLESSFLHVRVDPLNTRATYAR